jgi:dUTP pyrophosphatase
MKVKRLETDVQLPTRAYRDDAGWDLYALEDVWLEQGVQVAMNVGLSVAIPRGHVGFIMGRSSMNKRGIVCHTGVIDCGYTGELGVLLTSTRGNEVIRQGDRIAQLVVVPIYPFEIEEVTELAPSDRGEGGFGSSGA